MTGDGSVPDEPMMVLCSTCGDAVTANEACPTCGAPAPQEPHADGPTHLDESLLNQVGVALAAQSAMAARTAAQRVARAAHIGRLNAETVELQRRLRTQALLLRRLLAERRERRSSARMAEALDRVEKALQEHQAGDVALGPWGIQAQLPRDPTCATVARRLLAEYVRDDLDVRAGQDALLVVSELAMNAFRHGKGSISLHVERLSDRLRIEVGDEGQPRRIQAGTESDPCDGGQGLHIVDELSLAWGTTERSGLVWADVRIV